MHRVVGRLAAGVLTQQQKVGVESESVLPVTLPVAVEHYAQSLAIAREFGGAHTQTQLERLARQCNKRWRVQLDPNINRGPWTDEEDATILEQQRLLGNKWATIAKRMPVPSGKRRSENQVKNWWYGKVQKEKKARKRKANTAASSKNVPKPSAVIQRILD